MKKVSEMSLIDQAGYLKAQIAAQQERLNGLNEQILADLKVKKAYKDEGEVFSVARVVQDYLQVDYKAVVEKLEPSRQLLAAHSAPVHKEYLKYSARKSSSIPQRAA